MSDIVNVDGVKNVHVMLPYSTWKLLKRKLLDDEQTMREFFRDAVERKLAERKERRTTQK